MRDQRMDHPAKLAEGYKQNPMPHIPKSLKLKQFETSNHLAEVQFAEDSGQSLVMHESVQQLSPTWIDA